MTVEQTTSILIALIDGSAVSHLKGDKAAWRWDRASERMVRTGKKLGAASSEGETP